MTVPHPDDVMTVVAARALAGARTCFVGIGLPSLAANLARRLHQRDLVLIYESGTIGAKPDTLPLSIGDGNLARTADAVVSVPEIFNYWLQPGRIDVGFLGAAQIDRYANINTTVIGNDYWNPTARLPGAGGAPEIAANCGQVLVVVRAARRTFIEKVDFVTSRTAGPVRVVTDLGVLTASPGHRELTVTALHPSCGIDDLRAAIGWEPEFAAELEHTEPPTDQELGILRSLRNTS